MHATGPPLNTFGGAGMAQWWEHSPPTNVARARFSGYSGFPSPQKPPFDFINFVIIVNLSLQCPQLVLQR